MFFLAIPLNYLNNFPYIIRPQISGFINKTFIHVFHMTSNPASDVTKFKTHFLDTKNRLIEGIDEDWSSIHMPVIFLYTECQLL